MNFGQGNNRYQQPQPQQPNQGAPKNDRMRLGGLFSSKSGNALTGGMNMNYQQRNGRLVGEELIEMIRTSMTTGQPLRFLVFDNSGFEGNKSKSQYTLYAAPGQPRQAGPTASAYPEPVAEQYPGYEGATDSPSPQAPPMP